MANPDKQLHAAVEQLVASHGRYEPLELLLELGRLPYAGYEAWRRGELPLLEEALAGSPARVLKLLEAASAWAARLKLVPREEAYRAWDAAGGRPLRLFADEGADRLARTHYARDSGPQLDLFFDSGATAPLNDLRKALEGGDRAGAERALAALRGADPNHRLLPAAELLTAALDHLAQPPPDAAAELAALEGHLQPAAGDLLGAAARGFLAPFWRRLLTVLPEPLFDPMQERLHASWVAEQLRDLRAVIAAVRAVPEYERHPVLLKRLARAAYGAGQGEAGLAAACRLCWLHPQLAEEAVAELPDRILRALWEQFLDLEPPLPVTLLPAWLLAAAPGFAHQLPEDLGADGGEPGALFALMHRLVREGSPELRAQMKGAHPGLFEAWLARRRS